VATPQKHRPKTLEDAVDQLKRDPLHPVRLHVKDMEIEVRAVVPPAHDMPLGDFLASLGPWEGENTEELLQLLREGRRMGGSKEPPDL